MQTPEARIEELLALPDGWYDGQGDAVSNDAGYVALTAIKAMQVWPRIFPMIEGGLSIEYDGISLEVDNNGEITAYYTEEL